MAILNTLNTTQIGIPIQNAYIRIANIVIPYNSINTGQPRSVMLDVVGYATKPEQGFDLKEIYFQRLHVPLEAIENQTETSFVAKAYQWLMQQPGMETATAV